MATLVWTDVETVPIRVQGNPDAIVDRPNWARGWIVVPTQGVYFADEENALQVGVSALAEWAEEEHPVQYHEVRDRKPGGGRMLQDLLNIYVYINSGV